jgi:PAS domain S-box-containing protein
MKLPIAPAPKAILSKQEYRQLVEQSPLLVWRANLTMGCDYFNERWLAFTGRTLEQELGNGWTEGVHPDDLQKCISVYERSFSQRQIFEVEYRLRRHDGVYRWLFDRGTPYSDSTGNFAGYIGTCVDVTDRIESQNELRRKQEAEMSSLKELLPICAHCRNVRDDKGYWQKLESYLHEHSDLTFSHGVCPSCIRKLYPDIAGMILKDGGGKQ